MTWSVKGFVHCGITVNNLKTSLDFYTNTLGFELIKKQTNNTKYIHEIVKIPGLKKIEIAFIKTQDEVIIELLEYVGVRTYSGEARSCDYGTGHICLQVENLDEMFVDLKNQGVEFISQNVVTITSGVHQGAKAVYMKDPDGYLIELKES